MFSSYHAVTISVKGRPCPLSRPLHTGLHTWYVGARTAPAAIGGFTDARVPPTCRRLPRDFALFPYGYRVQFHLTGVPHQKTRSRPASAYQPSRRHVGGTGLMSYRTDECRTTSRCEVETNASIEGKSAAVRAAPAMRRHLLTDARVARRPTRAKIVSSGFRFSRHYPVGSHPRAFANGLSRQPLKRRFTGAAFLLKSSYHNRGTFRVAGSGG
jgi:hypothetical protein